MQGERRSEIKPLASKLRDSRHDYEKKINEQESCISNRENKTLQISDQRGKIKSETSRMEGEINPKISDVTGG